MSAGSSKRAQLRIIKEAEAVLDQKNFLTILLDSLPLALFAKDYLLGEGQFVAWNTCAEKLWGLSRGEVIGKTDRDFFPAEQAEFFLAKDLQTLKSMKPVFIDEEPVDSPSVGRRLVRTWKVPVRDTHGNPRTLLGISQDITQLKELEDQNLDLLNSDPFTSVIKLVQNHLGQTDAAIDELELHINRLSIGKPLSSKEALDLAEDLQSTLTNLRHSIAGLNSLKKKA